MARMPDDVAPLPREPVLEDDGAVHDDGCTCAAPAPTVEIPTRHGPAVAHVHTAQSPVGSLVLTHGAGGGVGAPDLVAVAAAASAAGWSVVLVEQPYRAAGKRVPPRPAAMDAAWCDVVAGLRAARVAGLGAPDGAGLPLVTGGRSAGARLACRTALETVVVGVVALAFPTQPPGRPDRPSRLPELDATGVPVLVVQGVTDPYGVPPPGTQRSVVVVPGDHGLKKDVTAVADAVTGWLAELSR